MEERMGEREAPYALALERLENEVALWRDQTEASAADLLMDDLALVLPLARAAVAAPATVPPEYAAWRAAVIEEERGSAAGIWAPRGVVDGNLTSTVSAEEAAYRALRAAALRDVEGA